MNSDAKPWLGGVVGATEEATTRSLSKGISEVRELETEIDSKARVATPQLVPPVSLSLGIRLASPTGVGGSGSPRRVIGMIESGVEWKEECTWQTGRKNGQPT